MCPGKRSTDEAGSVIDRRVATWAFLLPVMVGCASAPSATEPTSASPEPTILTLGREEQPLDAGTYRLNPQALGDEFPQVLKR